MAAFVTDPSFAVTASPVHHTPGEYFVTLTRLALPIIAARAGWMFLSFVDVLMVGRFSTDELAYMSLGSNVLSVAYIAAMGLMLGTLVVSSNLYGEQRLDEVGAVWRRSLPYAVVLGTIILGLTLIAEPLLLWTGQSAEIAREAGAVIRIYGYGMPLGGLVYVTSQYFLEGVKRPVPGMLFMLAANIVNVGLNWVLIYGHLGFEPMGAAGSAWATTIIRIALAIGIVIYIWSMPGAREMGIRTPYRGGFRGWAEQRRLGYAAGLSFGIEHVSFVMLFLFAGLLGTLDLAAVTVVFNTFAIFFMVAAGIASATAVQVGIAWGERNPHHIRLAGWSGWTLQAGVLLVPAVLMITTPALFVRLYTDDLAVITLALPMYVLGGFALILDTTQTLWSNALRGRHDKWFPTASHFVSYILLMVPLAWYFAFTLGRRGEGLFEALIVASVLSASALTWRFVALGRRDGRDFRTLDAHRAPPS